MFNFNWFGSREREELKRLQRENQELKEEIRENEKEQEEFINKEIIREAQKPYSRIILSGDIVTVILSDDTTLSKAGVSVDIIDSIKGCSSPEEIRNLLFPPEPVKVVKEEESPIVEDDLEILRDHEDFIIEDGRVFLKGVKLALPAIVLASFIELLEKYDARREEVGEQYTEQDNTDLDNLDSQYEALKAFTYKLFLCPIEEGRKSLLKYIQENFIRLTPSGNFIGFRRVNKVGDGNK